jgi:subtilisin family serine protease
MNTHVAKQIQRIIDEAEQDKLSVIVQMKTDDELEKYLALTTEAIEKRRVVTSARSLVPPAKKALRVGVSGGLTPAAQRSLRLSDSLPAAALLATAALGFGQYSALVAAGAKALAPLLDSDWVSGVAASMAGGKDSTNVAPPVHFSLSGSAVFDLSKDELYKLPQNVPHVADVFVNRRVRIPPVAKSAELPRVVEDNKANTWGLARTGALASWGVFEARGEGATVAVLDTGVDATHPDLKGKIVDFAEFDEDGRELPTGGLANAYDSAEHGTHCAGIIAGGKESGRWIGMAPKAKILAGLVLKNGSGTDAQILAGMEWAIKNGAQVISMSLGGLRLSVDVLDTYTRTIIKANQVGIPVVVAVGNEGSQTTGSPGNDYFAFTVGATDSEDWAAGFSGGRTQIFTTSPYIKPEYLPLVYSKPDVAAPGVDIYSSVPGGKWEAWNGTSMATPHVAGAMALLLGAPGLLRNQPLNQRATLLQSLLISTVKELGEAGQNHRFGHGRIDVLRALGYADELGYFA